MNPQLEPILSEIEKAVVGKRGVIEKILMALLAEGHILLDDVPGVGKTTLAVALYVLAGEGQYLNEAYATAFVLLVIVLALNLLANLITKKLDKKLKGSKNGK